MAVKTKDEILELVKARVGDDNSDEAIGFIEDITDTLSDPYPDVPSDPESQRRSRFMRL